MAKNPVEEFLDVKVKEASQKASDDLELWHAWNKGGQTPELMQPLIKKYEPLFNRKTKEWKAPAVAPAAFTAELKRHFIDAAKTFDPERGVAFNTHMQYRIQKAKRYNAKYQNVGYIPEGQAEHIGDIQSAQNTLNEQFGRAPTAAELAEHLDLPEHKVTTVLKALRNDIPSSKFESDPFEFGTSRENDVIRQMQRRPDDYFTAEESKIFQHVYGANGHKKITDTTTLATTLGVSMPKVSRLKTSIADKIKKHI
jgi:DNA-directed RNA polymerase specialized sigma subunit